MKNLEADNQVKQAEARNIDANTDLVKDKQPITEWNIKNIHQLILKEIDNENAGRYRKENVTIKGANHIPPDFIKIPELMEKLILNYEILCRRI